MIRNFPKCEIFSKHDVSPFPPEMKRSSHPNIVILGIPIGDKAFCATFISEKHDEAKALLIKLEEVSAVDPHVAFSLLRQCAGFCRLAHLARGTPPSQAISALEAFDHDIRATFSKCTAVDTSNQAWQQAELSLGRGGLGMRSLSRHSPAAYIASLSSSGAGSLSQEHLIHAVELFNSLVPLSEAVSVEEVLISLSIKRCCPARLTTICLIHSMSNLLLQIEHAFSLSPPLTLHLGCQSFPPRG